jgi:hypothetical protein
VTRYWLAPDWYTTGVWGFDEDGEEFMADLDELGVPSAVQERFTRWALRGVSDPEYTDEEVERDGQALVALLREILPPSDTVQYRRPTN